MRRIYVVIMVVLVALNILQWFSEPDGHEDRIKEIKAQRDSLEREFYRAERRIIALNGNIISKEVMIDHLKDSTDSVSEVRIKQTQEYYETKLKKARNYNVAAADSFFTARYPSPERLNSDSSQVESFRGDRGPNFERRAGLYFKNSGPEDPPIRKTIRRPGLLDITIQAENRSIGDTAADPQGGESLIRGRDKDMGRPGHPISEAKKHSWRYSGSGYSTCLARGRINIFSPFFETMNCFANIE